MSTPIAVPEPAVAETTRSTPRELDAHELTLVCGGVRVPDSDLVGVLDNPAYEVALVGVLDNPAYEVALVGVLDNPAYETNAQTNLMYPQPGTY